MKSRKLALMLFAGFTLTIFSYFLFVTNYVVQDSYTLIEGGSLDAKLPIGISAPGDVLEAGKSGAVGIASSSGVREVSLKALGIIPVKNVQVNTIKAPFVYPSGECVGVKMYSKGLVVSGVTDFETEDGIAVSPGAIAGVRAGDVIVSINGKTTSSVKEFTAICDASQGLCTLGIVRGGEEISVKASPKLCTDGHRRLGIYVKNSVAGVGTMTYVSEDYSSFGALGHGISDGGVLVPLNSATLYSAEIISVEKGKKGMPGELIGAIKEGEVIGACLENREEGLYGNLEGYLPHSTRIEAAPSSEVTEGKASLVCTVDAGGKPQEFDAKIVSVNRIRTTRTKSFVIEVTDATLLAKTGGIIQGMSGSPVLQNGKIVGAVTHVFVNDPTRGYGIFIENMLAEAEKIK